jgi:hypothetical protein
VITALTSSELNVTLAKKRSTARPAPQRPAPQAPGRPTRPTRPSVQSEVLDPWD